MTLDAPYQQTDRFNPHFGHMIQPLDEGRWVCLTCDGEDGMLDFMDWCDAVAKERES